MTDHRPIAPGETPPVVDQIAALLGRDLDLDLTDSSTDELPSLLLDLSDAAMSAGGPGVVDDDEEDEPERPPLEADLGDPEVFAAVEELIRPLGNPQLDHLMTLVRRQVSSAS